MPMSVNFDFPTDQEICQVFEISMKIMKTRHQGKQLCRDGFDLIAEVAELLTAGSNPKSPIQILMNL